jgi:Zn ribbon nucleic-acid-binding protein
VRVQGVRCPDCRSRAVWQEDGLRQCDRCGHVWDAPDEAAIDELRLREREVYAHEDED